MAMDVCKQTLLFVFSALLGVSLGYKHVILMHGVLSGPSEYDDILGWINKTHPGTTTSVIDAYNGVSSLESLWKQTNAVRQIIANITTHHPDGVNLLCYSQGGLLCRGVIQTLPSHNVHNFISLSSPQGGQYGDTSYVKKYFPVPRKYLYEIFYTKEVQKEFAVANYWNDPHHQDDYVKYSVYLAVLNNQSTSDINVTRAQEYKESFTKLKNLVLIGGPDDGVITPWQSSHFAAYDENEQVLEMRKQQWYIQDSFGLKTLDERNALHTYEVAGVEHKHWHANFTIFRDYIVKWLD